MPLVEPMYLLVCFIVTLKKEFRDLKHFVFIVAESRDPLYLALWGLDKSSMLVSLQLLWRDSHTYGRDTSINDRFDPLHKVWHLGVDPKLSLPPTALSKASHSKHCPFAIVLT